MIRINLLPVPKARKQEALIVQVVAGLVILAGVTFGGFLMGTAKDSEIRTAQAQINTKKREIEELKAKVGEVEKYKQQAKVLEDQLGVIRSLENGRNGPVKMMDEMTDLIPRKLWVNTFKESGKKVTLDGVADSGPVIADFLENLKGSKYFTNPVLTVVQSLEQEGLKLHKFTITVNVKYDI